MKKNNMDIMMNNLNNNTTLDQFMVNPESKNQNKNVLSNTDNEGVYLVGFNGQFRTSRS
jgi:hypothetical protein